jgi:hypothetical protein
MAVLKRLVQARVDALAPPGMNEAPPFASEQILLFLRPPVRALDITYVGVYILIVLCVGLLIFQRRDVQ